MANEQGTTIKKYGAFAIAMNEMEAAQRDYMDAFRHAQANPASEEARQAQYDAFQRYQAICSKYEQAKVLLNDYVIQKRRRA